MRNAWGVLWTAGIVLAVGGCDDQPTLTRVQPGDLHQTAVQISGDDPCSDCTDYNPRGGDYPVSPVAGGGASADTTQKDTCPTAIPALRDPDVQKGLSELWAASTPPPAPIGQRREHFGWIVQTSDGKFLFHDMGISGTPCGFEGVVPWPPEGRTAIVAYVHTHPYERGEWIPVCINNPSKVDGYTQYNGQPSGIDRDTSVGLGQQLGVPTIPGIILDTKEIIGFSGYDTTKDGAIARCGY